MSPPRSRTYYELFGLTPDCSFEELKAAYRRLARERHPDVAVPRPGLGSMAEINEAWRVLSDTKRRERYDRTVLVGLDPASAPFVRPDPPAPGGHPSRQGHGRWRTQHPERRDRRGRGSRRLAWVAGMQAQIARLSRLAGRSATQALLIRNPRGHRSDYEDVVDVVVKKLVQDTEARIRAARAAGAAPLDLGVAACLVGIRSAADGVRRQASLGVTVGLLMEAELLDRMWDILAHELPSQLAGNLGGNPRVGRALASGGINPGGINQR